MHTHLDTKNIHIDERNGERERHIKIGGGDSSRSHTCTHTNTHTHTRAFSVSNSFLCSSVSAFPTSPQTKLLGARRVVAAA